MIMGGLDGFLAFFLASILLGWARATMGKTTWQKKVTEDMLSGDPRFTKFTKLVSPYILRSYRMVPPSYKWVYKPH